MEGWLTFAVSLALGAFLIRWSSIRRSQRNLARKLLEAKGENRRLRWRLENPGAPYPDWLDPSDPYGSDSDVQEALGPGLVAQGATWVLQTVRERWSGWLTAGVLGMLAMVATVALIVGIGLLVRALT